MISRWASGAPALRGSFRLRLTVLIAAVFILGGAALLGVQYLLVQQLFDTQVRSYVSECGEAPADQACVTVSEATPQTPGMTTEFIAQASDFSSGVLSSLLTWSVVVLLVFAALAVVAASWLSQRSLKRIGVIAETTRQITREDLHRRLKLDGPADEIRDLGDTIDGMLDRLEDSFTRQERFIASASHELRTPLTTTRTALEIPLMQGRVPQELEPDVRRALDATDRSARLISALLVLARGSAAEAHDDVDLVRLAYDAAALHPETQIRITGAATAIVLGDEELLAIAVGNLVRNAVTHGAGEIVVTCRTGEGSGSIVVTNAGAEYTREEAARLVEPFNRGTATRIAGGGVGLGLTLVDSIAGAFGGSVAVCPREGGGLSVSLELVSAEPA